MGDQYWTDIKRGTLMRLRFSDGQERFRRVTSVRHTKTGGAGDVIETVITTQEGEREPSDAVCDEVWVRHD